MFMELECLFPVVHTSGKKSAPT